jgi:hypothetical protein
MMMPTCEYEIFEALNPFFEVVMEGLRGLVDGEHYFDTIAEDAFFEFRYHFPGWPLTIRGRAHFIFRVHKGSPAQGDPLLSEKVRNLSHLGRNSPVVAIEETSKRATHRQLAACLFFGGMQG